ncbi:MAG TPA: transporter substrate-binding domain-containing protein [Alphaproteobacteria bacterium]|jgi:general L-amino acid transport system substrate-binding protein|nr:transporter substrate-binding domain-containing protein [Alphaproteobacteria bacterium]
MIRLILTVAALAVVACASHAGTTLDAVRARGHLTCGIAGDQPGLSRIDASGSVTGIEADVCRAVAAAIFGTGERIEFRRLGTVRDFLGASDIDLVVHGLTWTFARETELGVRFGPVTLYDGQALLVRASVKSFDDLVGRRVCARTYPGEIIGNLQRAFAARGLALAVDAQPTRAAAEDAFFAGGCDALSADATELAAALLIRPHRLEEYGVLPERLSKEPLAPLMRRGDDEFFDVVRWTVFALIDAEELGITARTAESSRDDPRAREFRAAASKRLGLRAGWTLDVVRAVGNYGEIYDRNLGEGSAARMPRGANDLWRNGGLMYAPPVR